MKYLIIIILIISTFSCSHLKPQREPLFSFGTYNHSITVNVKNKNFHFSGVNQWSKDKFVAIGLGPFDMTLLNYSEDLITNKSELYFSKELFHVEESKVLEVMGLMKRIYQLDRSICEGKSCKTTYWGIDLFFDLNEANQVENIKINKGEDTVNVSITQFSPLP